MALIDIGNAWTSGPTDSLFRKFLGAILVAAKDIKAEDAGTDNHANRIVWADDVLSGVESTVHTKVHEQIRYAAATNATMQANPTGLSDNDIQFIVNSNIDTFATGA